LGGSLYYHQASNKRYNPSSIKILTADVIGNSLKKNLLFISKEGWINNWLRISIWPHQSPLRKKASHNNRKKKRTQCPLSGAFPELHYYIRFTPLSNPIDHNILTGKKTAGMALFLSYRAISLAASRQLVDVRQS
jgi:hypothetical protein